MAKSARASVIKKNKSSLRTRVFGPVEAARNERLSAKLLELASQPRPPRAEMEVEGANSKDVTKAAATAAEGMDVDTEVVATSKPQKSKREIQRIRAERAARIAKKRKPQNTRTFASHSKKRTGGGKRR